MNTAPRRQSWNVAFYNKWRPFVTLSSILRLRAMALRDNENKLVDGSFVKVRMRHPFRGAVELREVSTDLFTLEEVLHEGIYSNVANLVPGCKSIVDLGANIGFATLYFGQLYPGSKIVSVEPHPENYSLLCRNVSALEKAGRCFPVKAAIWSRGDRTLTVTGIHATAFCGMRVSENPDGSSVNAPSITMAGLLGRHQLEKVDLLKVDIEGAEIELFRGDNSWLDCVGAIAIEFHDDSRRLSNFDETVRRFGFIERDSSAHTLVVSRPHWS